MNLTSTLMSQLPARRVARWGIAAALVGTLALALTGTGSGAPAGTDRTLGWRTPLGNGEVSSFAEFGPGGAPRAIGLVFSGGAFNGLPDTHSDGHHCADRDGDGIVARPGECFETHEYVIPLPDAVTRRDDIPFKWSLLNWNRHGHAPPGIYDVPHFDVHFYMTSIAEIMAIPAGACGPEFVDCDAYAIAKQPLPAGMMHPDFADVDAVAPAMGNHLIDLTGREFGGEPFTRSWLYGVYGGRVIFYEEMVTLAYLQSRPAECLAIKATPEVAVAGFYPTQRCIRYEPGTDTYVVSMEAFVYRGARQAAAPVEPTGPTSPATHRH